MRLTALLILCLFAVSATARTLPTDYPGQVRLLTLHEGDRHRFADSLEAIARRENNQSVLRLIALHRLYYDFTANLRKPADVERDLLHQLNEEHRSGHTHLEAQVMVFLSQFYILQGQGALALEYGLRARERYRNWPAAEFPPKYAALYGLACRYGMYQDYSSARHFLREALATRGAIEPTPRNVLLNSLGMTYRSEDRFDSAEFYFRQALKEKDPSFNQIWTSIIRGNLGITYVSLHRYRDAEPLLRDDIAQSLLHAKDNAVNSMAYLGRMLLDEGRTREATLVLEQAWAICREQHFLCQHKLMGILYPELAKLRRQQGRNAEATEMLQAALISGDSFQQQMNGLVASGALIKIGAEQHRHKQELLEQDLHLQKLTRNALLAGIFLLAAIAVLVIQQQRVRGRLREAQADMQLQEASRKLQSFTRAIQEKNELIERFRTRIARSTLPEPGDEPEAVAELRALTILTEEEWQTFQSLFDRVHTGFLDRLRAKLPGLTAGDTRYAALLRLELSNKEIGGMLGIGAGSVRSIRSRLRKRLGLAEADSLEAVVYAI